MIQKIAIFWFRKDLRLTDNVGLHIALKSKFPVLPLYIFNIHTLEGLPKNDARVSFVYDTCKTIYGTLQAKGGSLYCRKGNPLEVFKELTKKFDVAEVYSNKDYEPYSLQRDTEVQFFLESEGIVFKQYKDYVLFEENEILKNDKTPYTVYTPYKNKWHDKLSDNDLFDYNVDSWSNYLPSNFQFPSLQELGFIHSEIHVRPYSLKNISSYEDTRNIPSVDGTTNLGPHLSLGTVSIRQIVRKARKHQVFVDELVWREFFKQILFHFPHVVGGNFKKNYAIGWRNNEREFEKWRQGITGYPLVDAGMRELNATGYMHNRVRMVTASFLCKHLLIDWTWGEAYFAEKLLDYDLASNNGNWQWVAGTGCDAAPYFRIFNPETQIKKFDSESKYVRKWIPELDSSSYPKPMVEHSFARERAISTYKKGILKK